MCIQLFQHNRTAYECARSMIAECGKAAVVHPTGTGKSYIAFRFVEDNPEKTFLWLSPSEYIFKTQTTNLLSETPDFPIHQIVYATYAKLMLMTAEEIRLLSPDFIILDEFHRCGAEQWGQGVKLLLEQFPHVPLLGLSATAIRYLDNNRNMADELFDGDVASEMTLGEAVVRGILPEPVYVSTLFRYMNELDRYQKRIDSMKSRGIRDANQKYLDALRRTLEKADGLNIIFQRYMTDRFGRYIVFCANVEHMREMVRHVPEWFGGVDTDAHIYAVYSDAAESSTEFEAFRQDNSSHLKLLFCIDMLNEGVHVAGISGTILFRPTISPIIYKQQIGRALTSGVSNTPLIIDVVNNAESLSSIDSLQQEMDNAVHFLRENGRADEIVTERFQIKGQAQDCRKLFDRLERSINSTWDIYYEAAKAYASQYGSIAKLPYRYITDSGLNLGKWVFIQRNNYLNKDSQYGPLTPEQIKKLDAIGMRWGTLQELSFSEGLAHAKEYFAQHGNLLVPAAYICEDGFRLGSWITHRREGNQLTEEQIHELESIGMVWAVESVQFDHCYQYAKQYFEDNGNLDVPTLYTTEDGFPLGTWISSIRRGHAGKKGARQLSDDQKNRLDAIGMRWDMTNDCIWTNYYEHLKTYYAENSSCDVPRTFVTADGCRLGEWVRKQMEARKMNRLSENRIQLLDALDFCWNKPVHTADIGWMSFYTLLRQYYEDHGNFMMRADEIYKSKHLGHWVVMQRRLYHAGKLSSERCRLLDEIHFEYRSQTEQAWDEKYLQAKAFLNQAGVLSIPAEEKSLRLWLNRQRKAKRDGRLSEEQLGRLTVLGL